MIKFILGIFTGCALTVSIAAGPDSCNEWKLDAILYEASLLIACDGDADKARNIKAMVGDAFSTVNNGGRYVFEVDRWEPNNPDFKAAIKILEEVGSEIARRVRNSPKNDA